MALKIGSKFFEYLYELACKYTRNEFCKEEFPNNKCCILCRNVYEGKMIYFITETPISTRKEYFHKDCISKIFEEPKKLSGNN